MQKVYKVTEFTVTRKAGFGTFDQSYTPRADEVYFKSPAEAKQYFGDLEEFSNAVLIIVKGEFVDKVFRVKWAEVFETQYHTTPNFAEPTTEEERYFSTYLEAKCYYDELFKDAEVVFVKGDYVEAETMKNEKYPEPIEVQDEEAQDTIEEAQDTIEEEPSVTSYNVGASDYSKHRIQPWDIWEEYQLNPWDADIVKRVLRTKATDSRQLDYEKIIHICKYRIEQLNKEYERDNQ